MNGISGTRVDVDLNQESRISRFFAVKGSKGRIL